MDFAGHLLKWYRLNMRDLPWRNTRNPYFIWLSEVILQQTRVDQGLPYYLAFTRTFPNVKSLARASEQEVLKLWQGLGYYSRARNLHATAKEVAEKHKGKFPESYEGLIQLKGIGDYTASAISSFCFDEPKAVVDGNVYRVLSRIYGIETPIDSTQGKKEFKALAEELLPRKHAAEFNQAIMEFGATACTPKKPLCATCPFVQECHAFRNNRVHALPVKGKKTKVEDVHLNYLVHAKNGAITLEHRSNEGIWKNLYHFPCVISNTALTEKTLSGNSEYRALVKAKNPPELMESVLHKLSHRNLHIRFFKVEGSFNGKRQFEKVPLNDLAEYPVPIVIARFIDKHF